MVKKKASKKKVSTTKAKKKIPTKVKTQTIIATKNALHGFDNAEILVLQQSLIVAKAFEQNASKGFSQTFLKTLARNTPSYTVQIFSKSAFRVVPPGRKSSALDDKATFGAGGRVNIGMKQQDPLFKGPISYAQGGIYCSKDASTAQMEYESVVPGSFEIVELQHATGHFILIDFDSVVGELDSQLSSESLSVRVHSAPFDGAWKYQPFPLASQLLGNWLRHHAGTKIDGLFFRSIKDPHGTNFFIFSPNDWSIV